MAEEKRRGEPPKKTEDPADQPEKQDNDKDQEAEPKKEETGHRR